MLITAENLRLILNFLLSQIGAVFDIVWKNAGLLGVGIVLIPLFGRVFTIIKKLIS